MEDEQAQESQSFPRNEKDLMKVIEEKEREKNTLLALSNEIASIREKTKLLPVLQNMLNAIGFYDDLAIDVLDEEKKSFGPFLIDGTKDRASHPDYEWVTTYKHPYPDGFFEIAMVSKEPQIFHLEDLMAKDVVPRYIKLLYESGIREMISVALKSGDRDIGALFLFSKTQKKYSRQQFALLKGIANQLATAVAKILTEEARLQQEIEKTILLSVSYDIAKIRNKADLWNLINGRLKDLFPFDHAGIGIINLEKGVYNALLLDGEADETSDKKLTSYFGEGYPIENDIINVALNADRPVVFDLDELASKRKLPLYTQIKYALGMKELVVAALRSEKESFGFFAILSKVKNAFSKNHLNMFKAVSGQISIAVSNILAYEEIQKRENEKSLLLSLSRDFTACRTLEDVQKIVTNKISAYLQFTEIMICLNNSDNLTHSCYIHTVSQETMSHPDFERGAKMKYFINDGIFNIIENSSDPVIFDMDELRSRENKPFYVDFWHENNVKEIIGFSIRMNDKSIGGTTLYPKKKNAFTSAQLNLVQAVSSLIGITLSNILAYEKAQKQLRKANNFNAQLEQENFYLQEQIKTTNSYSEIVGSDNGLREVFELISNVAHSDSTVLISGETGTGKELIANAIHQASPRRGKLMVKINCTTLPAHLIESELFGHEKGSFTGATERRIGKFELANKSTLFLDEIGEMPLELQVKLLRAIQEKEIERIGGKGVIRTDVRIIAATNRDLRKEVDAGRFRNDLFYRLNVFPISLPPLRERKEDIPDLVTYFIDRYARKLGKTIRNVSPEVIRDMTLYHWPGNVRELEHVIERSMLMCKGTTIEEIHLPKSEVQPVGQITAVHFKSIEENERDHILEALRKSNGKIRGDGGAAEMLKIPPTTLHSKMKKLGIRKTMLTT